MADKRYRMVRRDGAAPMSPPVVLLDFFDPTVAKSMAIPRPPKHARKQVALIHQSQTTDNNHNPANTNARNAAAASAASAAIAPAGRSGNSHGFGNSDGHRRSPGLGAGAGAGDGGADGDGDGDGDEAEEREKRRRMLFLEPAMTRMPHGLLLAIGVVLLADVVLVLIVTDRVYSDAENTGGGTFAAIYAVAALCAFAAAAFVRNVEAQGAAIVLLMCASPIALFAHRPDTAIVMRMIVVGAEIVLLHVIRKARRLTWIGMLTPDNAPPREESPPTTPT